jgi:hypothetical protein
MRFALPPECMRSCERSSPQDDAILDILPEHQRFTWGYPCVRVVVAFLIGPRLTAGGFGNDAPAGHPEIHPQDGLLTPCPIVIRLGRVATRRGPADSLLSRWPNPSFDSADQGRSGLVRHCGG